MPQAGSRNSLVIGVDIGGTKVAAGLVDHDGGISARSRGPMVARGKATEALGAVTSVIDALFQHNQGACSAIRGIGICSPGPLDPNAGVVINPPNLPCWRDFPLAAEVSRTYQLPVRVDNDANAAALAEALWGAGRGFRNVFCTTLGTGIGTGLVLDGHVYHGRTGAAGEGGHMSIDYRGPRCTCGKRGCIETLASGPAIAKRARLAADLAPGSSMLELAGGNLRNITSEIVGAAYARGDQVAREVLCETVDVLTLWLGNIVDLLEPDIIILGGGIAFLLAPFFDEVRDRLPSFCINPRSREIPVVPARYGADVGIAGGAALCSQMLQNDDNREPLVHSRR